MTSSRSSSMMGDQPISSSDKGESRVSYLVPPLPQTRASRDKENPAMSPPGISSTKSRGLHQQQQQQQGSRASALSSSSSSSAYTSSGMSKYQSSLPLPSKRDHDSRSERDRKVLVPLPFTNNNTSRSTGGVDGLHSDNKASKNTYSSIKPSIPLPSSRRRLESAKNSASTRCSRKVLRYRETIEGLFGITLDSSEEYRQLCRDIVDGHLADDAASWCRVLEIANSQERNCRNRDKTSGKYCIYVSAPARHPMKRNLIINNSCGISFLCILPERDLIRLHRRATSRFSLVKHKNDQTGVFQIWLSFAELLSKTGATDECREVFAQMRESHCGLQQAAFYLALADFERHHDTRKATEALQLGIKQKAHPEEALKRALSRIESTETTLSSSSQNRSPVAGKTRTKSFLKSTLPKLPTSLSPRKRKAESDTSPKRRRTEDGAVEVTEAAEIATMVTSASLETDKDRCINYADEPEEMSLVLSDSSDLEDNNSKNDDDQFQGERSANSKKDVQIQRNDKLNSIASIKTAPESQNKPEFEEKESTVKGSFKLTLSGTTSMTPIDRTASRKLGSTRRHQASSPAAITATSEKLPIGSQTSTKTTKRPPRLLSKTPRLRSSVLGGKAQRVGLEHSVIDDSDSDSDDSATNNMQAHTGETQSLTKVSKLDLGYMLAWDPGERRKSSTSDSKSNDQATAPKPTIDEKMELRPSNSASHEANPQSSQLSLSLTRKSAHSTDSEQTERSHHSTPSSHPNKRRSVNDSSSTTVSPTTAKIIANSNPEFLPLVSESNILKVNSVPYVKLGVVGKGGSSKVYRALTKDCTVLAIKKVKLSGMDKKAIDGFANEIALLKRLKDNSAIIQIYDSEVDLKRKAIFVVMEAGEADLNHVLQQHSVKPGSRLRALSMNFIRLTWQQMLSAVHSIHEERIIHGDLKPANFLFVRGALKLIDFGIAKAMQSDDTTNIYRESQIGTLNYMSPEAILDTGGGKPGAQKMKCGRVSIRDNAVLILCCFDHKANSRRVPFLCFRLPTFGP